MKERPPEGSNRLGDLVGMILGRQAFGQRTARLELEEAFKVSVDEERRRHLALGSFRRGVVEILVDHPILLQELQSFEKDRVLAVFRQHVKSVKVKGIKFKRL